MITTKFNWDNWEQFKLYHNDTFKAFFSWDANNKIWISQKPVPQFLIEDIKKFKGQIYNTTKTKQYNISEFLYPYQKEAAQNILRHLDSGFKGYGLFLQVGLGKTLVALEVVKQLYNDNRFIILAPSAIHHQYLSEIKKFNYDFDAVIIKGTKKQRETIYGENHKVIILTYETFRLDNEFFQYTPIVVADEASKLKNPKSKIHQIFSGVYNRETKTYKKQPYNYKFLLALTGTPLVNKLTDVYNLVNVIQPQFMWWNYFVNNFCETDYNEYADADTIIGFKNFDKYGQHISALSSKKTREEVRTDLPPIIYIDRYIKCTHSQHKIKWELIKKDTDMFKKFQLLRVLDNGSVELKMSDSKSVNELDFTDIEDDETNPKLEQLFLDLDEIGNEQVVIFTHFKNTAQNIYNYLNEFYKDKMVIIDGDTPNRSQLIEDYKMGKYQILIATDALGFGVSLDKVNYLVNYDTTLSFAEMEQRNGRIIRINMVNAKTIINYYGNVIGTYIKKNILDKKIESNDSLIKSIIEEIKEGVLDGEQNK